MSKLALSGGEKTVKMDVPDNMFHWPIVTEEDEQAVIEVMRAGTMSGTDITKLFEAEFAEWQGSKYALGTCNGTAALLASMWACGVGAGDEVICPGTTYWASAAPALQLGATVNFADILPDTLCIDPADIEHRIGPRTKLIVVVHFSGYPCDMDPIMAIAKKHNIKVLEDVSHAQGGFYKGRKTGTLGDIAAMSMMTGKSFAIGEGGMVVTDNRALYERCVAFGHYERTGVGSNYNEVDAQINDNDLNKFAGIALGGTKHRMNQTCSAMGRVQLRHYDARILEIQNARNRFWDLLENVPGVKAHRVSKDSGSTMGGWYNACGLYRAEELGGLPIEKFCEAVSAEGVKCGVYHNTPLHLHSYFNKADIFNQGKPTAIAFGQRDVRQGPGSLPIVENAIRCSYKIPQFRHDNAEVIEQYASAFRKVAMQAEKLI
jgi:perosamine synthetase